MYIKVKLVLEHYIPDEIVPDMMFKQRIKDVIYGNIYEYDRVFQIDGISRISPEDFDSFIQMHGYPVRPNIVSITANADDKAAILATYKQIGWFDDGPATDELRDIELKDINLILSDYNGELDIEIEDAAFEDGVAVPVLYMDKVTLSLLWDEDDYLYEQDNYPEEEWDDMDDNPDDDPED